MDQQRNLNALLDLLLPASADGRMPAASSLGLFDGTFAQPQEEILAAGLDQLPAIVAARFGVALTRLQPSDVHELVGELRVKAATFFDLVSLHTVTRYYEHPEVLTALGVETAPPWPRGHAVQSGDWTLLAPVRARQAFYRKA